MLIGMIKQNTASFYLMGLFAQSFNAFCCIQKFYYGSTWPAMSDVGTAFNP